MGVGVGHILLTEMFRSHSCEKDILLGKLTLNLQDYVERIMTRHFSEELMDLEQNMFPLLVDSLDIPKVSENCYMKLAK